MLERVNETRINQNRIILDENNLAINIGRTYREHELNLKLSEVYPNVEYDIDFSFHEESDPWNRATLHREAFEPFKNKINLVRFDHWLDQTHVCDCLKWMNRAYQLLRLDGTILIHVIDFMDLFQVMINAKDRDIEALERMIFTESDATGMYYNRTVWTDKRLRAYLSQSFFSNIEITREYSEFFRCKVITVKAVKKVEFEVKLAADGTLKAVK